MNRSNASARRRRRALSRASAAALGICLVVALPAASAEGAAKERGIPSPSAKGELAPSSPGEGLDGTRLSGRLANGLAYHIERVGEPGGETSFRLIVRVGHLHGLPEQQVAHVLEHIVVEKVADRAAKGSVWDRASRIGARLNASTGDRITSYYVDLPATDPAASAEALGILLDWASPGPLSADEIERERKAVIEEFRQGGYGEENVLGSAQLAALFPGNSVLAQARDPIGTLSATPPTIRAIYGKYHVPANMAVVIVGDIEPAATLRAIAARLGSPPGDDAPRVPAASHAKPSLAGGRYLPLVRKESGETNLALVYKVAPVAADTKARARQAVILAVADRLLRDAFAAVGERRERPMAGSLSWNKGPASLGGVDADYLTIGAAIGRRTAREALADALLIAETLRRQGFPTDHVEQAKADALQAPAATSAVQDIAGRWTGYFADGVFEPDAAEMRAALTAVTAADVNRALKAWLNPRHRDIFLLYPEADAASVPAAADIPRLAAAAERAAPVDLARPVPRELHLAVAPVDIAAAPVAVPAPVLEAGGYARWVLPRSGATLLFRRQEGSGKVQLLMRRPGGAARFDDQLAMSARAAPDIVAASGMGGLSGAELARYLGDRGLRLSMNASASHEQASAAGAAGDWPLLLGLLRERIAAPTCGEKAFRAYVESERDALAVKGDAGAADAFGRLVDTGLGGKWRPDAADLETMNPAAMCDQYRAMFGDSAGMTIVVEGDLDPAQVYAGALIALDRPAAVPPAPFVLRPFPETEAGRTVLRRGTKPAARVTLAIAANGDAPFASLMTEALQLAIFRRLRSEEKGTYSPSAGVSGDRAAGRAVMTISFECAPENVERLIAAAKDEIDKLGKKGPSDADIVAWRERLAQKPRDGSAVADAWNARKTLAPPPPASDAEIGNWVHGFFRSSRLHEFVLLPAE